MSVCAFLGRAGMRRVVPEVACCRHCQAPRDGGTGKKVGLPLPLQGLGPWLLHRVLIVMASNFQWLSKNDQGADLEYNNEVISRPARP